MRRTRKTGPVIGSDTIDDEHILTPLLDILEREFPEVEEQDLSAEEESEPVPLTETVSCKLYLYYDFVIEEPYPHRFYISEVPDDKNFKQYHLHKETGRKVKDTRKAAEDIIQKFFDRWEESLIQTQKCMHYTRHAEIPLDS